MRKSVILGCLLFFILLILAVPAAAESSTITKISPAVGYTGSSTTVTINGTNFNTSSVTVRLMMDDENNITAASPTTLTSSLIVCKFTISSSKTTGDWDLVVVNEDSSEVRKSEAFTISAPMTLTSISPKSAQTNNDSVDVTVLGTGLSDVSGLYLYSSDYGNITASNVDAVSATKVKGSLDLTDANEDTYYVCVKDSFGTRECDLSFEVTTDAVGSIDISSSPTGASIYVDGSYIGTTPSTADDLVAGSHRVLLQKSGYTDWAKMVKVKEGDTTIVDADLASVTTAPTPIPTTVKTVATTIKKSTLKVPTPWPSATATAASPLDPAVIVGATGLGLALVALRKH
jgi:hypothetical protein